MPILVKTILLFFSVIVVMPVVFFFLISMFGRGFSLAVKKDSCLSKLKK